MKRKEERDVAKWITRLLVAPSALNLSDVRKDKTQTIFESATRNKRDVPVTTLILTEDRTAAETFIDISGGRDDDRRGWSARLGATDFGWQIAFKGIATPDAIRVWTTILANITPDNITGISFDGADDTLITQTIDFPNSGSSVTTPSVMLIGQRP